MEPNLTRHLLIIYTYLDSAPLLSQGPWLRAWQRSWQRNGWQPRLLTRRIAEQHPEFFPDLAKLHKWCALARQTEPGFYSSIFTINHHLHPGRTFYSPPKPGPVLEMSDLSLDGRALNFGAVGWEHADLVSFDGLPIGELYHSGMPL